MIEFWKFKLLDVSCVSQHHLNRYIKYAVKLYDQQIDDGVYFEKHHILPSSMFPEFSNLSKNRWNEITLTGRQHYIAHFLLAKAFGSSMWYAFNQMKRVIHSSVKKSALYNISRQHIAKLISQCNTGRVRTPEERLQMSIARSNKVCVKTIDGQSQYISCSDFDPLIHRYLMAGRNHKAETKYRIGAGLRGKHAFSNEFGDTKFFESEDLAYENGYCIKGAVGLIGKRFAADANWYHHPKTNHCIRIKPHQEIPNGYIKGRVFDNTGFSIINAKNRKTMFNMRKKEFENICIDHITKDYINQGGPETKIIIIDNSFFLPYNKKVINDVVGFNFLPDSFKQLGGCIISKYGRLKNKMFCSLYGGTRYDEIGIISMTIEEYVNCSAIYERLLDIKQLKNQERFRT